MKKVLTMTQFETRVSDTFSMVKLCHMTSTAADEYVKEQIQNEVCRKYGSRYVYSVFMRGFVSGLIRVHMNSIWKEVEFCYLVDGVLYSTHKQSSRRKTEEFYFAGKAHVLGDSPGGHYWIGTDKPYTEPEKV